MMEEGRKRLCPTSTTSTTTTSTSGHDAAAKPKVEVGVDVEEDVVEDLYVGLLDTAGADVGHQPQQPSSCPPFVVGEMKRADTDSRLNLEDHENAEASTDEDDESGSPLDGLKMTINCPRVDHIKMVDNNKIMDINLLEATQSSPATTLSRDSSGRSPGTAPPSDSSGNHQEASSSDELAAVLLQEHQGGGYEEEVVKLEDEGSSVPAASSSPAPATKKLEPLRLGGGENVNETTLCSSATTSAPTNDMITLAQTTAAQAQQQAQQMEEIYDIMQLIGEGSSGSVWSARRRILVGTERERLSKQVFAVKEPRRLSVAADPVGGVPPRAAGATTTPAPLCCGSASTSAPSNTDDGEAAPPPSLMCSSSAFAAPKPNDSAGNCGDEPVPQLGLDLILPIPALNFDVGAHLGRSDRDDCSDCASSFSFRSRASSDDSHEQLFGGRATPLTAQGTGAAPALPMTLSGTTAGHTDTRELLQDMHDDAEDDDLFLETCLFRGRRQLVEEELCAKKYEVVPPMLAAGNQGASFRILDDLVNECSESSEQSPDVIGEGREVVGGNKEGESSAQERQSSSTFPGLQLPLPRQPTAEDIAASCPRTASNGSQAMSGELSSRAGSVIPANPRVEQVEVGQVDRSRTNLQIFEQRMEQELDDDGAVALATPRSYAHSGRSSPRSYPATTLYASCSSGSALPSSSADGHNLGPASCTIEKHLNLFLSEPVLSFTASASSTPPASTTCELRASEHKTLLASEHESSEKIFGGEQQVANWYSSPSAIPLEARSSEQNAKTRRELPQRRASELPLTRLLHQARSATRTNTTTRPLMPKEVGGKRVTAAALDHPVRQLVVERGRGGARQATARCANGIPQVGGGTGTSCTADRQRQQMGRGWQTSCHRGNCVAASFFGKGVRRGSMSCLPSAAAAGGNTNSNSKENIFKGPPASTTVASWTREVLAPTSNRQPQSGSGGGQCQSGSCRKIPPPSTPQTTARWSSVAGGRTSRISVAAPLQPPRRQDTTSLDPTMLIPTPRGHSRRSTKVQPPEQVAAGGTMTSDVASCAGRGAGGDGNMQLDRCEQDDDHSEEAPRSSTDVEHDRSTSPTRGSTDHEQQDHDTCVDESDELALARRQLFAPFVDEDDDFDDDYNSDYNNDPREKQGHCRGEHQRRENNCHNHFREEITMMKSLDHPSICKLYDVVEDDHTIYLIMEHCDRGELMDKIDCDDGISEVETMSIVKQVTQGLRYCHEQNIVHRDIKPENILFKSSRGRDYVKLIDFGISAFTGGLTNEFRVGTYAYVSPEVLDEKHRDLDSKVDMWALGVVMYVMLSGLMPFAGPSCRSDIVKGQYHPLNVPVSDAAKDLLSRLLTVDPATRYNAQQVLDHPWLLVSSGVEHQHLHIPHAPSMLTKMPAMNTTNCYLRTARTLKLLNRLKRFQTLSLFRRLTLTIIAVKLVPDLTTVRCLFHEMDANSDGVVSAEEFVALWRKYDDQECRGSAAGGVSGGLAGGGNGNAATGETEVGDADASTSTADIDGGGAAMVPNVVVPVTTGLDEDGNNCFYSSSWRDPRREQVDSEYGMKAATPQGHLSASTQLEQQLLPSSHGALALPLPCDRSAAMFFPSSEEQEQRGYEYEPSSGGGGGDYRYHSDESVFRANLIQSSMLMATSSEDRYNVPRNSNNSTAYLSSTLTADVLVPTSGISVAEQEVISDCAVEGGLLLPQHEQSHATPTLLPILPAATPTTCAPRKNSTSSPGEVGSSCKSKTSFCGSVASLKISDTDLDQTITSSYNKKSDPDVFRLLRLDSVDHQHPQTTGERERDHVEQDVGRFGSARNRGPALTEWSPSILSTTATTMASLSDVTHHGGAHLLTGEKTGTTSTTTANRNNSSSSVEPEDGISISLSTSTALTVGTTRTSSSGRSRPLASPTFFRSLQQPPARCDEKAEKGPLFPPGTTISFFSNKSPEEGDATSTEGGGYTLQSPIETSGDQPQREQVREVEAAETTSSSTHAALITDPRPPCSSRRARAATMCCATRSGGAGLGLMSGNNELDAIARSTPSRNNRGRFGSFDGSARTCSFSPAARTPHLFNFDPLAAPFVSSAGSCSTSSSSGSKERRYTLPPTLTDLTPDASLRPGFSLATHFEFNPIRELEDEDIVSPTCGSPLDSAVEQDHCREDLDCHIVELQMVELPDGQEAHEQAAQQDAMAAPASSSSRPSGCFTSNTSCASSTSELASQRALEVFRSLDFNQEGVLHYTQVVAGVINDKAVLENDDIMWMVWRELTHPNKEQLYRTNTIASATASAAGGEGAPAARSYSYSGESSACSPTVAGEDTIDVSHFVHFLGEGSREELEREWLLEVGSLRALTYDEFKKLLVYGNGSCAGCATSTASATKGTNIGTAGQNRESYQNQSQSQPGFLSTTVSTAGRTASLSPKSAGGGGRHNITKTSSDNCARLLSWPEDEDEQEEIQEGRSGVGSTSCYPGVVGTSAPAVLGMPMVGAGGTPGHRFSFNPFSATGDGPSSSGAGEKGSGRTPKTSAQQQHQLLRSQTVTANHFPPAGCAERWGKTPRRMSISRARAVSTDTLFHEALYTPRYRRDLDVFFHH